MAKETVEEFLARGGKIQKEQEVISLEKLLYNEGLFDHDQAQEIKTKLQDSISSTIKPDSQ